MMFTDTNQGLQVNDMYELKIDELSKILEKEEPEGVDFFLMADERPYNGIESHRAAILFAIHLVNENEKQTIKKAEELFGKGYADRLHLFTCDSSKAEAKRLDPGELLFVPDVLRKDRYGNKKYDSDWVPNDENCGKEIPYWYAFLEPPHGTKYGPEDLRRINAVLFPDGAEGLEAYEWTTDWSDIFDDGHEWWGASCWSVYDSHRNRFVVLLASATD